MPDEELDTGKTDESGDKTADGGEDDISGMVTVGDFDDPGPEAEEEAKPKTEEKKADNLKPKVETYTPRELELLQKNKDLNRALHSERSKKKDDGKPDEVLTDTQLLGIMDEYKDDPKTLLNVIKYQAEQAAKKAAGGAIADADVVRKKKEMDEFVHKTYPALLEDGSQLRTAVDRAKEELGISDHPYAELFGTAVTFLSAAPKVLKEAYDQGRKDALAGVGEKNRQDLVDGADLTPKGKPGGKTPAAAGVNADVMNRLGLKSKRQQEIFAKITGAGKGSRTVSVGD